MTEALAISKQLLNSKPILFPSQRWISAAGLFLLREKQCTHTQEYSQLLACNCFTETTQNNQSNDAMKQSSTLSKSSSFIETGHASASPAFSPSTQQVCKQIPAITISDDSKRMWWWHSLKQIRDLDESLTPNQRFRTERVSVDFTWIRTVWERLGL